jgi:polyisoprenoid-binding protein YceI
MKSIKITLFAVTALISSAFTILSSTNWIVKEDAYKVTFKGPKAEGIFKGLKATIVFDETNLEKSKFLASIDVNTINTGNGMKNKHAKSEDALNAKQFPNIVFESTSIVKKGNGYEAIGKLTIKGVARDMLLPFTFENKGNEGVFNGNFYVFSKDFNIKRTGTPEKVEINLMIPVKK